MQDLVLPLAPQTSRPTWKEEETSVSKEVVSRVQVLKVSSGRESKFGEFSPDYLVDRTFSGQKGDYSSDQK